MRTSRLHGQGVFATAPIKKGTRVIEYVGERISHAEADRRYDDKDENDNHTFLFIVDSRTVIDAGVDGNEARFINHACDPNCESVIEDRRVFIEAIRDHPARRGTHLRLSDPARAGRSARHRQDLRLPLRQPGLPRHDALAAAEEAARPCPYAPQLSALAQPKHRQPP